MAEEVTYKPISDSNIANILAKGSAIASLGTPSSPKPTSEQLKKIADSFSENLFSHLKFLQTLHLRFLQFFQ